MERVPRARRAGETAAAESSSKLRLALIVAVIAACAAAIAATPLGMRMLVAIAGLLGRIAGGVPGGAATLAGMAGAALLTVFFIVRRRGGGAAVPMRRAFRSQPAEASHDRETTMQVTGRNAFLSGLQDRLNAHAQEGRQLAVHRLDLARFRQINSRFGSAVGDRILAEVSRRLAGLAGDPAHLARLGDDEFAVIQPETGGAKHAEIFAARMQKALEEPLDAGDAEIPLTASIGIAVAPEHGSEAERLLASADLALQKAQRAGSGAVRFFAAEMDERLARRRAVETALRDALKDGPAGLAVYYRPQYDLGSRRLTGFEVEVRLEDPGLGTVAEEEFTPAAEAAGLLPAVAERAVREACRAAARWPQHLRIAFDLLPGHLRAIDIAKFLGEALKANHLSPGRVDLEVDEEVVSCGEQARERLRRLGEAGYRLVLDRHGSGHAGAADLWREPFSAVRIDAGLVGRLGQGEGAETLVPAIVKLAQALGLEVLADGAERPEQVHFLMLNGCRNVAGPVLGQAVAADKAAALIAKDARNAEAGEQAEAAA